MQLTRTPKPPSIFAALVYFNAQNKYQNKHLSFCFRSDNFCTSPEPIKHFYALEKHINEEIEPIYSYSLATIFCNMPGIIAQKLIVQRSPTAIFIDNRELLTPNFNFYSDRFLDEVSNNHKFSKRFVERIADSFMDMYEKIENERGYFRFNYSNFEMKQIINEYKIHKNSPIFQQYLSENDTRTEQ